MRRRQRSGRLCVPSTNLPAGSNLICAVLLQSAVSTTQWHYAPVMALAWERVRDDAAAERLWNATVRPVAREMASGAAELAERIVARLEAEGHQRPESAFIGFPPA